MAKNNNNNNNNDNINAKPGVYCFWNKINDKIYVGSAQDLINRLEEHFNNQSSNIPLQNSIKKHGLEAFHISQVTTKTHADALQLEQRCLDYLFGKNKPKYNIANKIGGGCIGSRENHKNLCEQGSGSKAKPFFIREYPSGKILLKAESTYDNKAQEFLKMGRSRISNQLTQNYSSLFIKLSSKQIVYLEYVDQSLSKRAELLGRSIKFDYDKIKNFKPALSLQHKDGRKAFLENYTTYSEAGRMLGLKSRSELCGFGKMVAGKIQSSSGWRLAK